MVRLITSIIAASALVISASAIDAEAAHDFASASASASASLFEEVASEEASIAFMPEEEFVSAAWEVEPVVEEEDTGLSLLAQINNYIQNLIYPTTEKEVVVVEEAEDKNINEAIQQNNVKRMVGSARQRRHLNKRVDGHQDGNGLWHYSLPKHMSDQTSSSNQYEASSIQDEASSIQDEVSSAAPELEGFSLELEISEQDMQKSAEMQDFPFSNPGLDPSFWRALLPEQIKKKIAANVKEKIDEAAEHNAAAKKRS